uniref:Transposase n=1 Tax=Romanomermis culicivorax TaxID=13658 RepID=A0A915I550_ROMCU
MLKRLKILDTWILRSLVQCSGNGVKEWSDILNLLGITSSKTTIRRKKECLLSRPFCNETETVWRLSERPRLIQTRWESEGSYSGMSLARYFFRYTGLAVVRLIHINYSKLNSATGSVGYVLQPARWHSRPPGLQRILGFLCFTPCTHKQNNAATILNVKNYVEFMDRSLWALYSPNENKSSRSADGAVTDTNVEIVINWNANVEGQ